MIIPFNGCTPQIAPNAFIAPTAVLIGDVEIGEGASIWYGAVLRGDHGRIVIGRGSNVQDNATLHVPENGTTVIKDNVTIGHGAVLEGCVVESGALIGMNAVVLQNATVGEQALLAAGSVVTEGMTIPPRTLAAGVPARVKKELVGNSADWIRMASSTYRELASRHREAVNALQSDHEKG
jgi:carbonic anhydrase/acetyltransferase-like protein (isoleucine patch superfamily)